MRDISLYLSTIPDYNQMLAGKNVLITTAARGIGKSIALLFARQGADVYFGGRNEEYVRTTEKELQLIRPSCRGYVVDLAKADQTESFVDAAVKDSGGFDILVSTVGVNCHCPAAEYKDEDMFRLLETNYLSGVRCARKVIPTMQARGGGSIINISSIHSLMSQPTNMLYAGTKGAMNAAARVMALDYAKDNIRVNTICPGVVISDVMYDDMDKLDDAGKKQLDAALHRCQPLEPGRMQDIANTALFFASNMSANITGQPMSTILNFVGGGATYICYVNGSQASFSTSIKYPVLAGGLAVRQNVNGTVKAMLQLMPMKIDQVGAASVMSNGTRYETADDMQVYLWYKGQYYATKLSEVNSEGYYLTGWYDNFGCAAGKRVRVIVAVKKD